METLPWRKFAESGFRESAMMADFAVMLELAMKVVLLAKSNVLADSLPRNARKFPVGGNTIGLPNKGRCEFGCVLKFPTKPGVGITLHLKALAVYDLSILRDLPIVRLDVSGSKVTDLSPLRGMKVKILNLQQTGITDFSPLLDMPALESVILPEKADIEILRKHRALRFIGYQADWDSGSQRPKLTAEEFWARDKPQ